MELLNKAKNMISNIGEETIAEASFEKDNEPKEKPQKEKKTRAKKTTQRPKREKKPRMQKTPKKEEYMEVDVAVEDTKFDTFRNARGRNGEDFIDYDDFEKSEQPDADTELEEDYVDVEDEIDSDTDFLDGKSKGVKFSDLESFDSFSEGRHASHSQYDYEDDDSYEEDVDDDYDEDLESLENSSTSGLGAVTYKDVLDRLGINEKILVPDDLMLDEDAANVKFDYQAPHGYNVTQVKEFHKTTMHSLAALMKMLKKRNVDVLKLAEELASADDSSEIVERSIRTARKIQHDKNLEIATHKKEITRLKELVDSQSKELKINKNSRARDSAQMQELHNNLEGMNNHLNDLQRMLKERDAEIARQQEFLSEKDTFLEKKEEENKNLLKFNADLKHSVQIITEQREAREREIKEQEEREKALQESQERKLREKIVVYESEDDESIINDMLNVKNLVTEREIEQEIQSAASLTDKDIISEEDLDVFASNDNGDKNNANTVDNESIADNESKKPKEDEEKESVDSDDTTEEDVDNIADIENNVDNDNNVDTENSENAVDIENSESTDSSDTEDTQSEVFARFEKAQKLLSAEDESDTDENNEKEEELESEDSNVGNADNGDTEVDSVGDNEGKDSESQETAEDVETEKSDDTEVDDSEDETADVNSVDNDNTVSNADNDSNVENVEDSKPVKVSRPKRAIVGEDDLEDSMSLLASGTAEIDFEKDLSAESSQELQERQLLNDIGMVEEDNSEELDMDALSSFLKKN